MGNINIPTHQTWAGIHNPPCSRLQTTSSQPDKTDPTEFLQLSVNFLTGFSQLSVASHFKSTVKLITFIIDLLETEKT